MASLLRRLSVMYLLSALAFGVAIAFDRDPALEQASRHNVAMALDLLRDRVAAPAVTGARRVADAVAGMFQPARPVAPLPAQKSAARVTPPQPQQQQAVVLPKPAPLAPPRPTLIVPPTVPTPPTPDVQIASEPPPAATPAPAPSVSTAVPPKPQLALIPPPPARGSVSPAEIVRVTERLRASLTREMLANFSLFIYVSKADTGPWAQHMYVFRKDGAGDLAMLYNWPASTGREQVEIAADGTRQPSYTPSGYYQLDAHRMFKNHYSGQWHQPMPYAMFFNWENHGLQTGLAIHGAAGAPEIAELGSRASAGCIRIAPENAALLFTLIRGQYKGLAPLFAYDRHTATMSNDGLLMHDAAGNLKLAEGYKVLVFVENFGGQNVVAAVF